MMWPFGQIRTHRTAESRRKLNEGRPPWHKRLRSVIGWPLLIAVGFWACASWIVISGDEHLSHAIGQVLHQPVLSRVDFARISEQRTTEKRRKAQQAVPNYFKLNQALVDLIQSEIRDLHAAVKASENYQQYQKDHAKHWALDPSAFDVIKSLTDKAGSEQFKRNVDTLARRLSEAEMIKRADVSREPRSIASHVMLSSADGGYRSVPKERLSYATNSADVEALANSLVRFSFDDKIRGVLKSIIVKAISPGNNVYRPIFVFDDATTRKMIDKARLVEPVVVKYQAGDRLVEPGRINAEALALLKIEHEEYLKQRNADPTLSAQWHAKCFGLTGVVLLATLGLMIVTYYCQPRVARKTPRAFAFASLLLIMLLFDHFILLELGDSPMWSVVTITLTAAILTISYTQVFAFGATSILALLTILTLGTPYGMMIVLLTVAAVTVLKLREIRTRMKMVEVGVATSLAASISAILIGMAEGQDVAHDAAFAALAALAGTSLVLVLLPIIEKAFRITTSLTLMEWADTSRPLLRQLIEKAPGTWQHSHLLGSMAETAAEEIGANGLLVRVGAYYHDIGKICKPNYYVENQESKFNVHQGLAPTMSLLVILTHVKDGLALAKEHRLPPVLHQFIAEHHGTTVVRYFHERASQEAKKSGDGREISDTEFRYPGPKPRSHESAILMLCDSVEGAVRSLQDPTPSRIESCVHDIFLARLMDGQFDDCDITLKELARVEQSLVKSLRAIHHGRIAYPKSSVPKVTQSRTA